MQVKLNEVRLTQTKIQGDFEQYTKTRQAIAQRLMYSFGFTYEQAQEELKQLVIGRVLIKEEYYKTVSRVGCSKVLTRKDRMLIWKYCKAIVDEMNVSILE